MDDLLAIYLLLRDPPSTSARSPSTAPASSTAAPACATSAASSSAFGRAGDPVRLRPRRRGPRRRAVPRRLARHERRHVRRRPPARRRHRVPDRRRGPARRGHRRRPVAGHDRGARPVDHAPGPVRGRSGDAREGGRDPRHGRRDRRPGEHGHRATIKPSDGVEWNVGADPDSFADVLALDVPVAFVPLDATDDVPVPSDILDRSRRTTRRRAPTSPTRPTPARRTSRPRATTGGTPPPSRYSGPGPRHLGGRHGRHQRARPDLP